MKWKITRRCFGWPCQSHFLGSVGDDVVEDDVELLLGVSPQQPLHERDELAQSPATLNAEDRPTGVAFQRGTQLYRVPL